ncbi:MAG: MgtC/SapB family protein [Acidobacteriota bacterium]
MAWLTGNWYGLLPAPFDAVALTGVAICCGLILGAERERKEKAAGLRTMTLVSVGAAVFTMVSMHFGGMAGDPGRIAAQIVSGVGFLGAGAILRGERGVQGLTTAATIWAMAAIGMTVGAGYAGAGLALSAGIVGVLGVAALVEWRYIGPCTMAEATVVFEDNGGKGIVRVNQILDAHRIPVRGRRRETLDDGSTRLTVSYCNTHKHHKDFLANLAGLDEVHLIEI